MTDEQVTIPQVTVLHGHTSPDTGYLVTDYPYGRRLRCQIRYWLHTAASGPYKQQTRFMSQTTNPRRPGIVWNQPKASTYAAWMVMYLDPTRQNFEGEDYVWRLATGIWVDARFADQVRLCGAYGQLTEESRAFLDALTGSSQRVNGVMWEAYEQRKQAVHKHYTSHGELPQRDYGGNVLGQYTPEDDYHVICAWVLAQASKAS